eukprot:m.133781 g.133781  ORF g.133781 m.133781 type:complete len:134 (+) comp38128_c0_seq42:2441-2842(+)
MARSKQRTKTGRKSKAPSDAQSASTAGNVSGKEGWTNNATSDGIPSAGCAPKADHRIFQTEIQNMMYAFGDCRNPLPESAALVEDIVRKQICSLVWILTPLSLLLSFQHLFHCGVSYSWSKQLKRLICAVQDL